MNLQLPKACRKLTQNRSIETKNAILEAGIQCFSANGYYKVNTKEIAKAAGISTGSFYGYYDDKKQLFIELVQIYKEELLSAPTCITIDNGDCSLYTQDEVIQHFVSQKLRVAEKYPLAFHHELNHMRFRDPDIEAVCNYYLEKEIDLFEKTLSEHALCLRIKNYKVVAKIIYQVSDNIIQTHLTHTVLDEKNLLIEAYQQLLKRYLFE